MEYAISAVWLCIESMALFFACKAFLKQKIGLKQTVAAFVCALCVSFILNNLTGDFFQNNLYIKMLLSFIIAFLAVSLTFSGAWYVRIILVATWLFIIGIAETIMLSGVSFILGLSVSELVWKKWLYMKRYIAVVIVLSMLFISGCTNNRTETAQMTNPAEADVLNTTLGYVPAKVSVPDWLGSIWGWDTYNDTLWLGVQKPDGDLLVAIYDTISDSWQSFALETKDIHNPVPLCVSVSGDSFWVLLKESYTEADIKGGANLDELGYYVISTELSKKNSICSRIPFAGDNSTEGDGAIICSVLALDANRALLTTFSTTYLIDPNGEVLDDSALPAVGEIFQLRVNDKQYIRTSSGYAELDKASLKFGEVVSIKNKGFFSSNMGDFLTTEQKALLRYDPVSGDKTEIFKWMNVALSYSEMGGSRVLENSRGEFFYPTSSDIIKVTPSQVPEKHTLTMVCFGDSSDEMYQYQSTAYTYTSELMDAIVRFNNTDPEFKIEIKPVVYENEAERDRLLIELATSNEIDIVDTSLLPENAIKDGLFVDMLPYIDADEELSRDDFIQPLLNAMLKNGALYEYTDKFTLLTMITRRDIYTGHEAWTIDGIRELKTRTADLDCLSRERLLDSFILAATAEFVDWDEMTCSFDSTAFKNWLTFLKEQPSVIEKYENPLLFQISTDLAGDTGFWARTIMETDYAVAGFPEAAGTGSYFVKLNGPFDADAPSVGNNTRLGILASGQHHDGAWRFVRMLMTGESNANIMTGIPVLKERFERAVNATVTNQRDQQQNIDIFNESDAEILREQVYNTRKLVHKDETLRAIIQSEATAYFEGQKSVDEAAAQIQSRVSIYLAEQS